MMTPLHRSAWLLGALATACATPGPHQLGEPVATNAIAIKAVERTPGATQSEVVVMGMIHGRHRQSERFSLDSVKALVRAVAPDVVLTEIPPDRLQRAVSEFRQTGQVSEPRVKVFPEYTHALFPLMDELDFEIVPTAAWTQAMARERTSKLSRWKSERAAASQRVQEAQDRAVAQLRDEGLQDDPWAMHGGRYDQIVAEGMQPYAELFNDDLGAGGWDNINAAHLALIEDALDRYRGQGKRILITFGAWHKHRFLPVLATRDDVRLRSLRDFLQPADAPADAGPSDVDAAAEQAVASRSQEAEVVLTLPKSSSDVTGPVTRTVVPHIVPPPQVLSEPVLSLDRCRILLPEKIHFETAKWVIKQKSYKVLDQLVKTLQARPEWRVRVEGHRDSRGEYIRIRITQRRARAVVEYLVAHGIQRDRLIAVGYGETRPIATNKTAEGRAKNRRIEIHLDNCKP